MFKKQQNRLIPESVMMLKFMNIEKKVHETKHNGMNVSTYYSELKIL